MLWLHSFSLRVQVLTQYRHIELPISNDRLDCYTVAVPVQVFLPCTDKKRRRRKRKEKKTENRKRRLGCLCYRILGKWKEMEKMQDCVLTRWRQPCGLPELAEPSHPAPCLCASRLVCGVETSCCQLLSHDQTVLWDAFLHIFLVLMATDTKTQTYQVHSSFQPKVTGSKLHKCLLFKITCP